MTSPETLYKKDVVNKLIFLPVTHTTRFDIRFGCYGVLKSEHGAEHFWTEKMVSGFSRFEGIRSVNFSEDVTDSVGHLLSFPMLTHTHIFGNHNNGYSHLKTAYMRSSADCRKPEHVNGLGLDLALYSGENYDF